MELHLVQVIAVYALPVIFAITLHEAAHGYVAKQFGDMTAYLQGRVSLNPLRHVDPFGTVALPLVTLAIGGIMFGWAKPVPVNFANLHRPKRDMLWVAAAGPAANLLMAMCWAVVLKAALLVPAAPWTEFLAAAGSAGIRVNVMFMVLNLLPLPPLDGGRIAVSLLPRRLAYRYARLEQYGIFILLGVIMIEGLLHVPLLGAVLFPPYELVTRLILSLAGL
jgi:Zn-dependent protease